MLSCISTDTGRKHKVEAEFSETIARENGKGRSNHGALRGQGAKHVTAYSFGRFGPLRPAASSVSVSSNQS